MGGGEASPGTEPGGQALLYVEPEEGKNRPIGRKWTRCGAYALRFVNRQDGAFLVPINHQTKEKENESMKLENYGNEIFDIAQENNVDVGVASHD